MTLRVRRRVIRLPAGESALTRMSRVDKLIEEYKAGGQPSRKLILRVLVEYHSLLRAMWVWSLKKK